MVRSRDIEQYKMTLSFTSEQREVLVGLLLGDAHLEARKGGQIYRLKIEQSDAHRGYVEHLYHVFRSWVLTPPQPKQRRDERSNEHQLVVPNSQSWSILLLRTAVLS